MLNIIITFDYELFFNESFVTEEDALIKPTYSLARGLEKYGINGTYFVDVPSILRYRQLGILSYPMNAENQILQLYSNHHDIQLHIHPHWYTTKYINGKWNHDYSHYRIHSFRFDERNESNCITAKRIICESTEYLNTLIKKIDSSYRCIAFRAGGFCLQPEQELLKELYLNGIRIESSICKGISSNSGIHYYNYFNLPKAINWWISPSNGISVQEKLDLRQKLFVVPIGSLDNVFLKLKLLLLYPKLTQYPLKGKHSPSSINKESFIRKQVQKISSLINQSLIFTADGLHYMKMVEIIDYYLHKHDCVNNNYYLTMICHPKFSGGSVVKNIGQFIDIMLSQYKNRVRFTTIKNVYTEINKNVC